MSHLFLSHELHELPRNDIVIELSVFLEDVETEEIIPKSSTHIFLNKYIELINDSELQHTTWELSSYWIDPIAKWIHGENDVCEQYGIEYGNFVKAVLKLANIVDEWINIARSLQDTDMVEKMKDTRELLVRDFVVPDSLYLRI
jgi:superfamily II RNA helicase